MQEILDILLRYLIEPDSDPPTLEEQGRTEGYSQTLSLSKPSIEGSVS